MNNLTSSALRACLCMAEFSCNGPALESLTLGFLVSASSPHQLGQHLADLVRATIMGPFTIILLSSGPAAARLSSSGHCKWLKEQRSTGRLSSPICTLDSAHVMCRWWVLLQLYLLLPASCKPLNHPSSRRCELHLSAATEHLLNFFPVGWLPDAMASMHPGNFFNPPVGPFTELLQDAAPDSQMDNTCRSLGPAEDDNNPPPDGYESWDSFFETNLELHAFLGDAPYNQDAAVDLQSAGLPSDYIMQGFDASEPHLNTP